MNIYIYSVIIYVYLANEQQLIFNLFKLKERLEISTAFFSFKLSSILFKIIFQVCSFTPSKLSWKKTRLALCRWQLYPAAGKDATTNFLQGLERQVLAWSIKMEVKMQSRECVFVCVFVSLT